MKKITLSVLLSASVLMATNNTAGALKIEDLSTMNFFKNKGITILGSMKVGEELTLVSVSAQTSQGIQKMTAFVTADKKYVIIGGGYNDKTGEQLTVPLDMSGYAKDAGFTVGKGKKEIFLFTDPECPYCKKMELEVLSKLSLDDYTVHTFLFPLSFHQHAEAMSMWIMSKETSTEKMKALHAISEGSTEYETASFTETQRANIKESLKKQMAVAQTLGVSGTPTIFNEKGTQIDWMALKTSIKPSVGK